MALSATIRAAEATAPAGRRCRSAFTLIELMVVTVLIISLSGLALAGMGVARQRAKIDKTKSTIRKLNEIIVPHYESYIRRRVPLPSYPPGTVSATIARDRLQRIRTLSLYEMPDSWADVANTGTTAFAGSGTSPIGNGSTPIPNYAWTATTRSYGAFRTTVSGSTTKSPTAFSDNAAGECLFLINSRGLLEGNAMEHFRNDEIGDIDGDGSPEFLDGWGRPIAFMRWPTGFVAPNSPIQINDPTNRHDPFDPMRVEAAAFAMVPLIYSAGPDGVADSGYGLTPAPAWNAQNAAAIFSVLVSGTHPGSPASNAARDNITNHDLTKK
jgi:type II secretory pathway pseudopilin PulG